MKQTSDANDLSVESGSGDKNSYVVAGAILQCEYGTQLTRLKLPFSHGVYVKGKAQTHVADYVQGINIISFGNCACVHNPAVENSQMVDINGVKKSPCIPALTMPWLSEKSDVLIEGQPALLKSYKQKCLYGGLIHIEDDGQNLD
ncbi:DUF4280 domain-containing protein [Paenibacillus sp. IHBB 10380]|uniref:DUF4280 domain-containing protein n=1 Tax=Paenibacillus sp. IHBB 10380 TaxID=1566358 RepID=UPI0009E54404|nr:DUF4280 domain-containing protein [Paenibacillus sp. IHBB 10380]